MVTEWGTKKALYNSVTLKKKGQKMLNIMYLNIVIMNGHND